MELEGVENPMEISEKSWNRTIDSARKAGYREGVEEGKQSVFQKGFDIGYEDAFKNAFMLGKYKGLATVLSDDFLIPSSINDILQKTRRGACHICVEELNKSKSKGNDIAEPPLHEVKNTQKEHSTKILQVLNNHFDLILKKRGVHIDGISL